MPESRGTMPVLRQAYYLIAARLLGEAQAAAMAGELDMTPPEDDITALTVTMVDTWDTVDGEETRAQLFRAYAETLYWLGVRSERG